MKPGNMIKVNKSLTISFRISNLIWRAQDSNKWITLTLEYLYLTNLFARFMLVTHRYSLKKKIYQQSF